MRRLALTLGVILTGIAVAAALLSWFWTPYGVTGVNIAGKLQPPGPQHWLGTDHFGRDLMSMVMVGARTSIAVALVAVGIGVAAGVPLGLVAAAGRGDQPQRHARRDPDPHRDQRHGDRGPRADHHHRHEVAAEMVGAQPVLGSRRLQLARDVDPGDAVGGPEPRQQRRGHGDAGQDHAERQGQASHRPRSLGSTAA